MAMDGAIIQGKIEAAFPDAKVVMIDLAGDGDHWAARVTSEAFRGKSRIAQHKLVYAAIGNQLGGELHALALQTFVPTD
jgi:stress-induced morphogen